MTESSTAPLLSVTALRQDVRFAGRMLAKSPLFTTIVVLTLAIGIGLNTAVFAAVDALMLRPLPGVRNSNELMQLYRTAPGNARFNSSSIPHFFDLRNRTKGVFSGVAAWSFQPVNITADGPPRTVMAEMVSANFFSVLGVNALRGRFFTPDEDVGAGAHPVAVLSYGAWKSLFASDPNVVGRTIPVNSQSMTIIGVAPEGFNGALPIVQPELWVPIMQVAQIKPGNGSDLENRGNNYNTVIARLAPGISVEQARARLTAVDAELLKEFPNDYEGSGTNLVRQDDAGIHPMFRGAQFGLSAVVMVVVAILLIIACVNVANLFLARARDRAREMAIRLALGARRAALVRQLLIESLLFSLVSGVAGLLVAVWAIRIANSVSVPMSITMKPDITLSPMVLGFAFGVTVLTGMLFGIAPALQSTSPALIPALKGEAPAGESRSRTSKGLVVAQMALSIVLLVCAALFLVNLRSATTLDKGFDGENLLIADVDPGLQGYARPRAREFYRTVLERLRANPMVRDVAIISDVPLGPSNSDRGVSIPGYVPAKNEGMSISYTSASAGYFKTMGIGLRAGREFVEQDDSTAAQVIVVNQRFADRFWPGQSAIGKTVRTGERDYSIVGVVPTGKYQRLGEDPTAYMYFAQNQRFQTTMSFVIRTKGDPMALAPTLRREIAALDPNLPVSSIRTMDKHLGWALMPARVAGTALGVFGLLGLLLASVGMYGVMAYSVAQRTREIGIRMAIGATASHVITLIMRQGLTLVLVGTAIGLAGAIAASRLLASVLYGSDAINPATFVAVPLVLIAVAAVATFVPARRAALVDPAITLRAE
ncbi:MAG: ABC transporter permease [Gemmatimonadaceae bacterium]|nr:ABC transporter permease [Gemmatimonadaceae bacterium]